MASLVIIYINNIRKEDGLLCLLLHAVTHRLYTRQRLLTAACWDSVGSNLRCVVIVSNQELHPQWIIIVKHLLFRLPFGLTKTNIKFLLYIWPHLA